MPFSSRLQAGGPTGFSAVYKRLRSAQQLRTYRPPASRSSLRGGAGTRNDRSLIFQRFGSGECVRQNRQPPPFANQPGLCIRRLSTAPQALPGSITAVRKAARTSRALYLAIGIGFGGATALAFFIKGSFSSGDTAIDHEPAVIPEQPTSNSRGQKRSSDQGRTLLDLFDTFIYEPIATTFRFLHLFLLFFPVIVAVPIIWIGPRLEDKDNERRGTIWWYRLLVASMSRAGASFIKLGQWAASRTDIFPATMCELMSTMHSSAPAHSFRTTKAVVETAFEEPFDDTFFEFDRKPLGVGAIAQVYKARLKPGVDLLHDRPAKSERTRADPALGLDGVVAVKVLHPRVRRTVQRDLRIMRSFASMLNAVPSLEWLAFPSQVAQFGEMMESQLDLTVEAENLRRFRLNFKDRRSVAFPAEYGASKSGDLLLEQYVHGFPLGVFLRNGGGVFQRGLASEGLGAFLNMLLIDNFVHADLHPGNIFVRFVRADKWWKSHKLSAKQPSKQAGEADEEDPTQIALTKLMPLAKTCSQTEWEAALEQLDRDGFRPQLIFIDTGLATTLSEDNRTNFIDLFRALAEFNGLQAGRLMVERSRMPESVIEPDRFARGIDGLIRSVKSHTLSLNNFGVGEMLGSAMQLVREHHVRLEGDFVNVVLGILLLEGIGRRLDPNLDLFATALPILRRLGSQSGTSTDTAMLKVWAGLEARSWMRTAVEIVERCVKSDLLAPNV